MCNYRHPGPRRAWKVGSEPPFLTPLPWLRSLPSLPPLPSLRLRVPGGLILSAGAVDLNKLVFYLYRAPRGGGGKCKGPQRVPKAPQRIPKAPQRTPKAPPNDWSLHSRIRFFLQWGPYESYGGIPTTIRRRISIRVFLDGPQVWLKPLLHQKYKKSRQIGSTWLDMGPYSVRMKRTGPRKLSKCLLDLWDTIKSQKIPKIPENPKNPGNP